MANWIKCSERMPDKHRPVIVFGAHPCDVVQNNIYYWDGSVWSDCRDDYEAVNRNNITHWMPLPEPPQE